MAAVDGASGEFDFDENGVAFPRGVELFACEKKHFALRFAERVIDGEAFFLFSVVGLRAEAEEEDPVSVFEAEEDGRSEVGSELVCVCIVPFFGRETQFRCEFNTDLHAVF